MNDSPAVDEGRGLGRGKLTLILLLALVVRGCGVAGQSLSMDEVIELSIARSDASHIVQRQDGFPPLYHLLLKAVLPITGANESSRWLSVAAGLVTVAAGVGLASRVAGGRAALVAGLLLAVSPPLVYFAQETRAYALYLALAALALERFAAAWRSDAWGDWLGFAAAITAAIFTHYYSALLAVLLAGMAVVGRVAGRQSPIRLIVALLVVGAAAAPATLLLAADHGAQSAHNEATPFGPVAWAYSGYAALAGFSLGPSLTDLHTRTTKQIVLAAAPWAALLAAPAAALVWWGIGRLRRERFGAAVVLLALAAVPVVGLIGEAAGVGYKVRYVAWFIVPLTVTLAAGAAALAERRPRLAAACLAVIVACQSVSLLQRSRSPRFANEDLRAVAAHLDGAATPDSGPVFVVSDYMARPTLFYLNGTLRDDELLYDPPADPAAWTVRPLPDGSFGRGRLDDDASVAAAIGIVADAARAGGFWLVYTRGFHGDPEGRFLAGLEESAALTEEARVAGAVLYRGRLDRP